MSEKKFKEARDDLSLSQQLLDKHRMETMALQESGTPMEVQQPQDMPVEAPTMPQEAPQEPVVEEVQESETTPEQEEKKDANMSIQDLSAAVASGFEALTKLAEAVKENTKEKQVNVGKLRDRLSKRKTK